MIKKGKAMVTKKCPFCAEEIQEEANKCKYCGEFLNKKKEIGIFYPLFFFLLLFICTIVISIRSSDDKSYSNSTSSSTSSSTDCSSLWAKHNECITRSYKGLPCRDGTDIVIPPECRN